MSVFTVTSIFICLVGLQISAQDLHTAEYTSTEGEVSAKKSAPQISQRFDRSSGSNYGQGSSSYGVGGSGELSSPYGGTGEYGQPEYGRGRYGNGGGSYSASSSYKQSPSYDGDYVGARHTESDLGSELSIKGLAKEYLIRFLSNAFKSKDASSTEDVGSTHLSGYQSYQDPVMPVMRAPPSLTTPLVKCATYLLISCTPLIQVAPYSLYSSYGTSSYGPHGPYECC